MMVSEHTQPEHLVYPPGDDALLALIAERRQDTEFMERLQRLVSENQDVLDKLAGDDDES